MSVLPSHVLGHRESMQARKAAQQASAERVWTQVEAERRAVEERTAKRRAMRLARESAGS